MGGMTERYRMVSMTESMDLRRMGLSGCPWQMWMRKGIISTLWINNKIWHGRVGDRSCFQSFSVFTLKYTAGFNIINYIDTAYPYHDGESEPFLGRILAKYARDSYYLATKLPVWLVNTAKEAQAVFDGQLDRLQVSYVDYYLFHALNRERWEKLKGSGIIEWAEQLKQEGKIRHLGFSFHDDYEVFREIITYRQWDFCQIQYN